MSKMHNKARSSVEGSDFFGRESEIAESWSDLKEGNHILITAPRRVGKSSLVKKLIQEARDNGWKAAYIDVQEVTDVPFRGYLDNIFVGVIIGAVSNFSKLAIMYVIDVALGCRWALSFWGLGRHSYSTLYSAPSAALSRHWC